MDRTLSEKETAGPVNYLGDFRPRCASRCFFPIREVTMIYFHSVEAGRGYVSSFMNIKRAPC